MAVEFEGQPMVSSQHEAAAGIMCNACNVSFSGESSRGEHYRSDWHRYNLKRKVAGLPGVTATWFHMRQDTLAVERKSQEAPVRLRYRCSVCEKDYSSSKAHANHLLSKAHLQRAAKAAPTLAVATPVIRPAPERASLATKLAELDLQSTSTEVVGSVGIQNEEGAASRISEEDASVEEEEGEEEGEWEEVEGQDADEALAQTARDGAASAVTSNDGRFKHLKGSLEEEEADEREESGDEEEEEWEWDAGTCLFCGSLHGGQLAACIEHMHQQHGFFVPDAEYLDDPEGMLTYLALKIERGHMCLLCDERGRMYTSADAARKHMLTKNHCKLRYGDGSGIAEAELEDYYDFSSSYVDADGLQMVPGRDGGEASTPVVYLRGGLELVLQSEDGSSSKVLGSREFAKYYKQRPKPSEGREGVLKNAIIARYRSMGLSTRQREWGGKHGLAVDNGAISRSRAEDTRTRVAFRNNVNWKLPKNVAY